MDINVVTIVGRTTGNVELSYTPNTQTAVARFTIAVDRPKVKGEDRGADFVRITVWGKQAENCNKYLVKGQEAGITGHITTGSYKNDKGDTVYTTEVTADNVQFGSKPRAEKTTTRNTFAGGLDQQMAEAQAAQANNYGDAPQNVPPQNIPPQAGQVQMNDIPYGMEASDDDEPF